MFTDSSTNIAPLRPSQLDHELKAVLEDYPAQAAAVSFNLVDSHDTNRVLFELTEAGDVTAAYVKQRLVALLQFTSFGAPMIYYGDEAGINAPGKSGFGDPYNRAPYPWADESGNVPADADLIPFYSQLASIRHSLPALRTGSLMTLLTGDTTKDSTDNGVYAFARVSAPQKPVVVALNKSDRPATVTIPLRGLYPDGTMLHDQRDLVPGSSQRRRRPCASLSP